MNWPINPPPPVWPNATEAAWPKKKDDPITQADIVNPIPSNSLDVLDQDQLLILWAEKQKAVTDAKNEEIELRKYIVSRAFPEKQEGTNTKDLGNGYELKAVIKYNYNLAATDIVEKVLDKIAKIGNQGAFIADRLVSWSPSFLLTEYRNLQSAAESGSQDAQAILATVDEMLTVTDAAPTLAIKEPKKKK